MGNLIQTELFSENRDKMMSVYLDNLYFSTETLMENNKIALPFAHHKHYTKNAMNTKRGYVSLFSSAGVGCYGFKLEGYDCIASSEIIPRRLDVQRHNSTCSLQDGYVPGDITDPAVHNKIFTAINSWKSVYKRDEVDVLIATPPCQGISVANHKKNDEIGRNSLVIESIKIIHKVSPRYFIFENVRGFLNTICTDTDGVDRSIQDAIYLNLGGSYNIAHRVLNFKDYGSNSSRTRTLVIGVRKDIEEVTPYELFPHYKTAPTLKELIDDLPKLENRGDIAANDIYHMFRSYDERMLDWIKDTREGQSAFDNEDELKRPHRMIDGKIIPNQNKNGDKYKRCYWDMVAPCVHTRNDILASQNTIHPEQPRVFSVRELMRFMSIPEKFKWAEFSSDQLNGLSLEKKREFLKKHEVNIRQSLGEGVPTEVFRSIAYNIREVDSREPLSLSKIKRLVEKHDLKDTDKLLQYLAAEKPPFVAASKVAELANARRLDDAAYYTRQDLCFGMVSDLPQLKHKRTIRVLEPSVGVGNFLPTLFEKYQDKHKVLLDLVDISIESTRALKKTLRSLKVPENFELRIINDDFLLHEFRNRYDIVIGNPPFGKVDSSKLIEYKKAGISSLVKSRNIFALFYEKALRLGDTVAFISPKSILNAPEFGSLRKLLEKYAVTKINDYGEKGFSGVKIETVSLIADTKLAPEKTRIESFILKNYRIVDQQYVTDPKYPYWLVYRDRYFDSMADNLELGLFSVYRDRTLTSKSMKKSGKIKVLKSRNIINGDVVHSPKDQYVDDVSVSPIASKFFNVPNIVVAPNLSYYPRATFLPKNTIVDGSAAILVPNREISLTRNDLSFFSSREYFLFYRIARNYATRSLNIDSGSVFFWALPKSELKYEEFNVPNRSAFLFATHATYFGGAP